MRVSESIKTGETIYLTTGYGRDAHDYQMQVDTVDSIGVGGECSSPFGDTAWSPEGWKFIPWRAVQELSK